MGKSEKEKGKKKKEILIIIMKNYRRLPKGEVRVDKKR